ncbi:MAG: hypothetical protein ACRC5H_01850 [Treponemataceae bacterium]
MKKKIFFALLLVTSILYAQNFEIITLGSDGGVYDGNVSGYLLKEKTGTKYLALDAGTLLPGIKKALEKNNFSNFTIPSDTEWTDEGYILREGIAAYFISHAHIDHVAGLVISSTEDTTKPIYALNSTIKTFTSSIFNWKLWPNFGNEGKTPLNQYFYHRLKPQQKYPIDGTNFSTQAFSLSHSGVESTMFLIQSDEKYLAYYGDLGSDAVEKATKLETTFKAIAPLIREKKLKAIMIEVSFPNEKPDQFLFGHLTPEWLNKELDILTHYAGTENMEGLNIIITHIKPSLKKNNDIRAKIIKELTDTNTYKVNYFFPTQGDKIEL